MGVQPLLGTLEIQQVTSLGQHEQQTVLGTGRSRAGDLAKRFHQREKHRQVDIVRLVL